VDLFRCYHCMYQCSTKQFFTFWSFLNIFWNMNMVSRELNGLNLIGLQWLHHCLTISPSHFSLSFLNSSENGENLEPKNGVFVMWGDFTNLFDMKNLILSMLYNKLYNFKLRMNISGVVRDKLVPWAVLLCFSNWLGSGIQVLSLKLN